MSRIHLPVPIDIKPGTQVTYVPWHANGDVHHPDCEDGFITSAQTNGVHESVAYVRYFHKHRDSLRTTTCSERTPTCCLVLNTHHPQTTIDMMLKKIQEGQ